VIGGIAALVFALVVSLGGWVHARHGAAHHSAHDAAALACLNTDAALTVCDSDAIELISSNPSSDTGEHTCCADLSCHGGVGLATWSLPASGPVIDRERFVIVNQTLDAWSCLSLERPPRTTVQI
jgi:hypothetical protein